MLRLQTQPNRIQFMINCTIKLPASEFRKLPLNCANYAQSGSAAQRARYKAQHDANPWRKLDKEDPKHLKAVLDALHNASPNQFTLECFDGKNSPANMAFMACVSAYNKDNPDNKLTKADFIKTIQSVKPAWYKSSRILTPDAKDPHGYGGLWAHQWKLPLEALFANNGARYDSQPIGRPTDQIYVKVCFVSEPNPAGDYDKNGTIKVASFHRDSDSGIRNLQTNKPESWWAKDTDEPKVRDALKKFGRGIAKSIDGLVPNPDED